MITSFMCGKDGKLEEVDLSSLDVEKTKKFIWVDLEDPSDKEFSLLTSKFNFHPLTIEDSKNEYQIAKIEDYDTYSFIIIHTIESHSTVQLNFFLGRNYLVTVHLKSVKAIGTIKEKLEKNPSLLGKGADFFAYSIFDTIVNDFFPMIDEMEDRVDIVEDKIFRKPGKTILSSLFRLKRELLFIRKVVWPLRDILSTLSKRDFKYIQPETANYFRDVYDHVIRIIDIVDVGREIIASSMEGYLSVVSNNLNVVMKKLTSVMAIIMVPTLIAAIYGMNFKYMPELTWPYGYYSILFLMLFAAIFLFIFFRKKDWI